MRTAQIFVFCFCALHWHFSRFLCFHKIIFGLWNIPTEPKGFSNFFHDVVSEFRDNFFPSWVCLHVPRTVWHYISCWAPSGWGEQHFQTTVIHSQCCSPAGESGGLFRSVELNRTRTPLRGRSRGVGHYSTCCSRGVLHVPNTH